MTINVLGAGTWGTTLAYLLSKNNINTLVWLRDNDKANVLNNKRKHHNLNKVDLSDNITFTSNIDILDTNNLTIVALPTHTINYILPRLDISNSKILIASKGYDINTSLLPVDLLKNMFDVDDENIAVISGPNHAEEIILDKATATVISSKNSNYAGELQQYFSSDTFRVYTSNDVIGVQLGGAVKNVIAIAAGLCSGLNLGDNTSSALVCRGMNELISLSSVYNAEKDTLYGLSGLGDLIATCYSKYSRNWQLGDYIGKGFSLDESVDKISMSVEGVNTCKILNKISNDNGVDMPICNEVYKILFEGYNPKDSLKDLMSRSLKKENKE